MQVQNVQVINKGFLRCSFDLVLDQIGITFRRCKWFRKGESDWIAFPQQEFRDHNDPDRKRYFNFIVIDPKKEDSFRHQCLALLEPMLNTAAKVESVAMCQFNQDSNIPDEIPF